MSRYRARLSGPLVDRLDLHVDVPALSFSEIHEARPGESSADVRERVVAARRVMMLRQRAPNAALAPPQLRSLVRLGADALALLQAAVDRLGLSGRAHDRVLQVALTVRDLTAPARSAPVELRSAEIAEALAFRRLDRKPAAVALGEAGA